MKLLAIPASRLSLFNTRDSARDPLFHSETRRITLRVPPRTAKILTRARDNLRREFSGWRVGTFNRARLFTQGGTVFVSRSLVFVYFSNVVQPRVPLLTPSCRYFLANGGCSVPFWVLSRLLDYVSCACCRKNLMGNIFFVFRWTRILFVNICEKDDDFIQELFVG